jgi:hypothetical protein
MLVAYRGTALPFEPSEGLACGALPCAQLMMELARSYKEEAKAILMRETKLSATFSDCTCRCEIACQKRGGSS